MATEVTSTRIAASLFTTPSEDNGWVHDYTHPSGDGDLHVPATGTENNNKILRAGDTPGSFSWSDIAFLQHDQILWTVYGANLGSENEGISPMGISMPYVGEVALIEEILIRLGTAPDTNSIKVNILRNDVSVFGGTEYMELGVGETTVFRGEGYMDGGSLYKDDILKYELIQGDSSAADLSIHVRFKWNLTNQ